MWCVSRIRKKHRLNVALFPSAQPHHRSATRTLPRGLTYLHAEQVAQVRVRAHVEDAPQEVVAGRARRHSVEGHARRADRARERRDGSYSW